MTLEERIYNLKASINEYAYTIQELESERDGLNAHIRKLYRELEVIEHELLDAEKEAKNAGR